MLRIDLHTHTSASDGNLSPRELVALAARKGLAAIAITDHDTFAGLDEGKCAAEEYGINFVPGIEISALYNMKEFHMLGLFIDWREPTLTSAVKRWFKARCERNEELLANLNAVGVNIGMEDLLRLVVRDGKIREDQLASRGASVITRSHFGRAIVEAGYCSTKQKAFDKYLLPGTPTYVDRRCASVAEAIAAIHSAGGISILAHPFRYGLDINEIERAVDVMKADGLRGIECYYSGHDLYQQEKLLQLAKKYRLCISGGSDFHGGSHDDIELGTGHGKLFVPASVYEELKILLKRSFK